MVIKSNDITVANMNGIAYFVRANVSTLVDFLSIVNSFAVMPQYGGKELDDEEIVYLTEFWSAK